MEPNDPSNEKLLPQSNDHNNDIGPLDSSPAPNGAVNDHGENTKPEQQTDVPNGMQLTVEELYDKDKHDLSTMEPGDVFQLLQ
jgi:hypothetical protein